MKKLIAVALLALTSFAYAEDKPMTAGKCTFANAERLKAHTSEHMKFPAKGKAVKAACKKEWPDEFSAAEWACIEASIKDDATFKSQAEVLSALGVK